MRRLLALTLALVGLMTTNTHAQVTWEAVPGLSVGGRDRLVTGAVTPAQAAKDGVRLRLTLDGTSCGSDWRRTAFTVDETSLVARPAGRCQFLSDPVAEGPHQLGMGDGAPQHITVGRQVIVSIGDSVASGEGNPDRQADLVRAKWLDRRCHRSLRSGSALAAMNVEQASPRSSVAFVALACSGATVPKGLENPYDGIEPDRNHTTEPAQIDVLNDLAERQDTDAVLLSVGANDIYFSKIVEFCARLPHCQRQHFDPSDPLHRAGATKPTLDNAVTDALAELERRYNRLNAEISARIPRHRILISQYFDPTIGGPEGYCKINLIIGTVDPRESEWAHARVLTRLNDLIRRTARNHHWTLVDGVAEAFAGHGICARPSDQIWIRTLQQSILWQDPRLASSAIAGTLHPNRSGHRAIARQMTPKLAAVLHIQVTPADDRPDPGDHRVLGIRVTLLLWIVGALAAVGILKLVCFLIRKVAGAAQAG